MVLNIGWRKLRRGHPLSTYAKFSEKLTFLTPWYAHVPVRIRGLEMLVFREILRTYLMDDPERITRSFLKDNLLSEVPIIGDFGLL